MKVSQQDSDLIDKFLQSRLSDEEAKLFQQRIGDDDFAEELDLRKQVKAGLTIEARSDLRRKMSEWDTSGGRVVSKKTNYFRWAAAAAVLILFGLLFYLARTGGNNSEALYLTYYKQYPNLVDPIVKGEASDDYSISQLYELGRYDAAIGHTDADSLQLFYQALAHLELGDFEAALDLLKGLSDDSDYRFHDASEWYLALSYLRMGDDDAAEALLDSISLTFRHDHRGDADRLLKELRR